ncbi:hypothetical protein HKD37_01G000015 [Glycine soja]|uniref:FLZ-type domain-containing protein n=1 Tax=Glycine soja TaxID=3848 RepID=A0A0B2RLM4_GLYSO|nr:FCS-Like Zinc finger 1-like [Glycine soja]KAG5067641.1 hypothetical protein JHK85_000018 [Glycine max]KAG5087402.1 hypothetical protein JHK86_000014 [Glycine max]KAH1160908.1 hypothetical protein GYH30_000023 [Glycine max]KAH1264013.1 hypothetical protein GmHk_01G000018 [Glycine max]KHN32923.1 hypothetical protein glysoja_037094 [Glycine soja]
MENSNSNSRKPPKNGNRMILERGVVGLGIVAAMNSTDVVVSSAKAAANFRGTTTYDYGIFYASPLNNTGTRFPHFLNSCNLCDKHLHGVDIFIYRGEKAFCSAECRETHISISNDDHQDVVKCRSRVVEHNPVTLTSSILAAA